MVRPRRVPRPMPKGKVGVKGACELLGVVRSTLYLYMKEPDFPQGEMVNGYLLFDRTALLEWKAKRLAEWEG